MRLPLLTIALVAPPTLGQVLLKPAAAQTAPAIEKLARADDEARGLLWANSRLDAPKAAPEQKDIADAAVKSFGLLEGIRSWRNAFGPTASTKRELLSRSFGGQKLALSLGNVSSPSLAGFASTGLSASYGFVEMGTSLKVKQLESAFATWDGMMTGKEVKPATEERDAMWLRAKPWQAKQGELELSWMNAERDQKPGAAGGDKSGTFWGGKGRLALPMGWSLNGDWTQAQVDDPAKKDDDEGRMKWNALAAGPIAHPFGEAKATIEWHETEAGYSTLTGSNTNGESVGNAQLVQDVKTDLVQGQLKLVASRRARLKTSSANAGEELEINGTTGTAQAKVRVLPNLSINVNGAMGNTQKELAETDFAKLGESTQNEVQTQSGDLGIEWKADSQLSIGLSTGRSETSQRTQTSDAENWANEPDLEENRVAANLRHQRKDGLIGVQLAARNRAGKWATTTAEERWQRLATVRLEAEQKLLGDFKIRTILDLAQDRDTGWGDEKGMARRAEAQLSLTKATRLDLKFRDGAALPNAWLGDSMGSPFGSALGGTFQTGDREFGARFNTGSAAGGKGLGLALEFARAQRTGSVADTDMWKVGITYR